MGKIRGWVLGLGLLALWLGLWGTGSAWANAAPPESASGAGPAPDASSTQVRMVSERVVLTVAADGRRATVHGQYWLRNEGAQTETLAVRFPLSYLTDEGSARAPCPEIRDLQIQVDGRAVSWSRQPGPATSFCHADTAPWAVFEVTFPPGQEVVIEATYTQDAWGHEPYWVLTYIVETGAGWYGTIGQGEIQVVMPYSVSPANIVLDGPYGHGSIGYGRTTPEPRLEGQTLTWTFNDLEPDAQDNLWVLYVDPALWAEVEARRADVRARPQDGDAWGFLGLALKRVLAVPIGWDMARGLRTDPGAQALLREALDAYAQAVALRPNDPDWHFGYGELLTAAAQTLLDTGGDPAQAHAYRAEAARELAQALALDPQHAKTRAFLQNYGRLLEGWVTVQGDVVTFVGLTATPPAPTPRPGAATPTPSAGQALPPGEPEATPTAAEPFVPAPVGPSVDTAADEPVASSNGWLWWLLALGLCGGVFAVGVGLLWLLGRSRREQPPREGR